MRRQCGPEAKVPHLWAVPSLGSIGLDFCTYSPGFSVFKPFQLFFILFFKVNPFNFGFGLFVVKIYNIFIVIFSNSLNLILISLFFIKKN
jgi:hypothetical protein